MANPSVTLTVSAQLEKVRKVMVELYNEKSNNIADMIERAGPEKVTVSRYLYRMPIELLQGGNFHKINMDGGSLGIGTSLQLSHLEAGFISTARSYRVTDEQRSTSEDSTQSTVNVFERVMSRAIPAAKIDDDISLHGTGTGILTNSSSATNGSTTLTFAGATDTLGINRLFEGMTVDVWDSTGATKRAPSAGTAPTYILSIDYINNIVTLSQSIASLTLGDILAFPDLDVYGPSTLTSFSSTWPGGALTNGPGLTGDSFRHGLYYANDITTSNYYLTRLKSTIPQLLPAYIDGTSSTITFDIVQKLLDQNIQKRGQQALKGLKGVFHMAQRRALFNEGVNISNWNRGQTSDKMPDLYPSNNMYDSTFDTCGVPCFISHRQYRSRVDYFVPADWGRAQTEDIHFKEVGGKNVFEVRNSDGTIATEVEFHVITEFDWACPDPGKGMYVDQMSVPA